jgi:4-hydroxy-tetrahydrodipicolinate synthase
MSRQLKGTVVPLVTPLQEDHSVCENSVRRLITSVADSASALLPCLSSGEGKKLSRKQWEDMVTYTVIHSQGIPVFPGAMVDSTDELTSRAKFAANAGAAAITVVGPGLGVIHQKAVIDAFVQLIQSLPASTVLYNQESDGESDWILEGLTAICRHEKIIAIKESSRRPEIATALRQKDLPVAVFQGWEDLCYQSQKTDGNALALSNLEPRICAEIYREPTEARQKSIIALCEQYGLFDEAWYVPLKTELWKRGILATNLIAA